MPGRPPVPPDDGASDEPHVPVPDEQDEQGPGGQDGDGASDLQPPSGQGVWATLGVIVLIAVVVGGALLLSERTADDADRSEAPVSTPASSTTPTGDDGSTNAPTGPPTEIPTDLPTIPTGDSTGTAPTGPPTEFTNLPPEFTELPSRIGPSSEPSDIDSLFPQ
ncbi:hypothetical protein [Nocardioides sp. SYSU DS0651]|uniref:hypothetical protein n=1 Tax=Nocardioides sp. SYSU DS0651 TaxID=3415955 RepID=UPI003F4B96B2